MDWNIKIKRLMGEATQLVRSGHLADATRAIQQALGGTVARPSRRSRPTMEPHPGATDNIDTPTPSTGTGATPLQGSPLGAAGAASWRGGSASDVEDAVVIDRSGVGRNSAPGTPRPSPTATPTPTPKSASTAAPPTERNPLAEPPGSFTRVVFKHPGAKHNPHHYHLYVPPGATAGTPMPLVLMLHGCTQNPVDFSTGTGMNAAAAPANALVLYPEQPHSANPNGCWNWFSPGDQHRDSGEPALLVAMVHDVVARHPVDAQRVYVAGLSAGGAMAALLGREYPDVFAAVGVHSGLQAGAAHNVMGALSAMKSGAKAAAAHHATAQPSHGPALPAPPLIVFHGDADTTVHARNGEQLIEAALAAAQSASHAAAKTVQAVHHGRSPHGKGYTRTVYSLANDQRPHTPPANPVVAEHWVLQGAGHAWAGGHAGGSHTDPGGVDATQEMLRFFLEHPGTARR